MGRCPSNNETKGLKKGPWTPEEDRKLMDYIQKHGHGSWPLLPRRAGLNRCGKSCRLRWTNYLRPDIKRGNFSPEEEQAIIHLHSSLGNKWSMIASHLPGRTDNEIKNFWNAHLRKKLLRSGIDPNTHRPITNFSFPVNSMTNPLENLAKIRMLQSMLQILTADNPLPSFCRDWGSETVNQFDRPLDGMLSPLNAPLSLPNLDSGNLLRTSPPFLDIFKATPEVGLVEGLSVVNCTSNTNNTKYLLPGLVPGTPEISAGNQVKSTHSSVENQNYDDNLFIPENSGGWDTVEMDDEAIGSFWKDIFDESFLASFS